MAQHLRLLADSLGAAHIMSAGRSFTERFLIAVSKMSVDGAPEVRWVIKFLHNLVACEFLLVCLAFFKMRNMSLHRHHGQIILQQLALHKDFLNLWTKIVPEKDRRSLDKILKRAKLNR